MEYGDRNADIRGDLEIITNSMHMLPPWVPAAGRGGPAWWSRFKSIKAIRCSSSPRSREITKILDPDVRAARHQIHDACIGVLKFFDMPALFGASMRSPPGSPRCLAGPECAGQTICRRVARARRHRALRHARPRRVVPPS